MGTTATTPGETFRHRLREAREARPMSQRGLAARLTELGLPMSQAAVTRIERGDRKCSLDEAVAIAAALDVAPMHLFLPIDGDDPVQLAPALEVDAPLARAWARGEQPLRPEDARFYAFQAPSVRLTAGDLARLSDDELAQFGITRRVEEEGNDAA